MSDTIYSRETGDYIGTATYSDDRDHYSVTALAGRPRSFTYFRDAVDWLNVQYDRSH
jgi:hypothetical protein